METAHSDAKAVLTALDGRSRGATLEILERRPYTIGRGHDADLQLRDLPVSRLHCKVEYDGSYFWLVDTDSDNGTYVNDQKVQRYMLYDGDTIRVGKTHVVVKILQAPTASEPRPAPVPPENEAQTPPPQ